MNKIIISTVFLFLAMSLSAQVTIGSAKKPLDGTLLMLDDGTTDGDANSEKGLGLPRVELTTLTPADGELAESIGGTSGSTPWDKDEHVGLMVYNVTPRTFNETTCKTTGVPIGLYVWNGGEWQVLGESGERKVVLGTVTGISGTVYKTRVFGDAGEWMIENLRETAYELPEVGVMEEGTESTIANKNKTYYYPADPNAPDGQHTGVVAHDRQLFDAHPEYGLFYKFAAASNEKVTDRFDTGAGSVTSTVQGICPKGWLLPSDKDWTELEKEISAHPELYSTNEAGSTMWSSAPGQGGWPDSDWAAVATYRGEHGDSMRACKTVEGSTITGNSTDQGFNGILVGSLQNGKGYYIYGGEARWFSSSVDGSGYGSTQWIRGIRYFKQVDREKVFPHYHLTVRCMKSRL